MKKEYTKPKIMFEDFALSTNIAGSCEVHVQGANAGTCGLWFAGQMIFQDGVAGCLYKPTLGGDGSYNGMCYHVPISSHNLFNS